MLAALSTSTANLLTVSGWGLIILLLGMIIIPYWRGRADLATAWNFVLIGCAIFIGVACLEAVDPPKRFVGYVSFDFPDQYYRDSLFRSFFFLGCLFGFYYVLPVGRNFASKRFTKSPPWSAALYAIILVFCAVMVAAVYSIGMSDVAFFREAFFNLGQKAAVFGVTFAFYGWYRKRSSPFTLIILLVVMFASTLYVIQVSHGRRLLLCVAFAPVAVMYWTKWRYKRPSRVLLLSAVAMTIVIGIGLWYQSFRFFDKKGRAGERSFANILQAAEKVDFDAMGEQLETWRWRLPQGAFPYGLVTKRLVETGKIEPIPLNSLRFALSYPIPRRMWHDKPMPLGGIIVTDILKLPNKTNWGLGVAGQSYYEGDWVALFVYALLLVLIVRMIDEPLKREPNNPFFISVCAAASLYIITWLRGDLGVHTVDLLECFVFLVMLQIAGALFAGARSGAYALDFGSVFTARRQYQAG